MKEKRGVLFNAIIKETGKIVTLRQEPEWTLFQDFYADYRGNEYYREDEFEREKEFRPLEIKLTDKETLAYDKFCDEHAHWDKNFGAMGGAHSLIITGTGLGWVITARCNACGETKDITDYECW